MPEESAAGEAGQEETRSAGEGQEAFLVETALAKSLLPDRPPASRTLVRNGGGHLPDRFLLAIEKPSTNSVTTMSKAANIAGHKTQKAAP